MFTNQYFVGEILPQKLLQDEKNQGFFGGLGFK